MLMEQDLHLQLLRPQLAVAEGMFLVDEFDGDYWFGSVEGAGFADAVTLSAQI
jgi:hypothetical protein